MNKMKCPFCNGRGDNADGSYSWDSNGNRKESPPTKCQECNGSGYILYMAGNKENL